MASRFQFPELSGEHALPAEDEGAGFLPIFQGNARPGASTAENLDDWSPLTPPGTRPTSEFRRPTSAAPATPAAPVRGPERVQTEAAPAPRPAAPPERPAAPAVDPRELERIKAQARQEGYQEGLARGTQEGRAAWQTRVDRLEPLLLGLSEAREQLLRHVREDLVRILSIVPARILRRSLQLDRGAISSLVTSILEELPRQERVLVKIAPEDLKILEEALPEIQKKLGGYTRLELEASTQVTGGGVVLVVDGGRIDATIERQLETFEQRAREWFLGEHMDDLATVAPISTAYTGRRGNEL